jgi:hypothetical protein
MNTQNRYIPYQNSVSANEDYLLRGENGVLRGEDHLLCGEFGILRNKPHLRNNERHQIPQGSELKSYRTKPRNDRNGLIPLRSPRLHNIITLLTQCGHPP